MMMMMMMMMMMIIIIIIIIIATTSLVGKITDSFSKFLIISTSDDEFCDPYRNIKCPNAFLRTMFLIHFTFCPSVTVGSCLMYRSIPLPPSVFRDHNIYSHYGITPIPLLPSPLLLYDAQDAML